MNYKNPKLISDNKIIPFSLLIMSFLRGIFFIIIFIIVMIVPALIKLLLRELGLGKLLPPTFLFNFWVIIMIFWISVMIVYYKKLLDFMKRRPLESFLPSHYGGAFYYANFCLLPIRKWIVNNIVCNKCKGQLQKANLVDKLNYINNPRLMGIHMFKVRCGNCKKDFLLGTEGFFDRTLRWISDNK